MKEMCVKKKRNVIQSAKDQIQNMCQIIMSENIVSFYTIYIIILYENVCLLNVQSIVSLLWAV